MKPAYAASLAAALICHALLLFGFKMETPARPLALSDEPSTVDVSLVASAPAPAEPASTSPEPAPAPAEAAPTPPEPAPTPQPASTPEPLPTPEMSTPPPEPAETPLPEMAPAPSSTPQAVHETPAPRPRALQHMHAGGQSSPSAASRTEMRPGASAPGPVTTGIRYRSNPKPEYPDEARRLQEEGVVLLSVEVSAEGFPTSVIVKRSSGFDILDQAAVRAVERWTFDPARVGPLPVAERVDIPIRFTTKSRD